MTTLSTAARRIMEITAGVNQFTAAPVWMACALSRHDFEEALGELETTGAIASIGSDIYQVAEPG